MACDVARLRWSVARLTERVFTFDSWEVDHFTYRNVYEVDVPTPNTIDSRDVEQANARYAEWQSRRDGPPPPCFIDGCAPTPQRRPLSVVSSSRATTLWCAFRRETRPRTWNGIQCPILILLMQERWK
jgi:hypothetical protein